MAYRIAFAGPPGSYKTTICSAIEGKLKEKGLIVDTSREYARCYISRHGKVQNPWEQLLLYDKQQECNLAVDAVSDIMLMDSSPMSFYRYAFYWTRRQNNGSEFTPAQHRLLEDLYSKSLKMTLWFDLIFLCMPNEKVVADGTRSGDFEGSLKQHRAFGGFLDLNDIDFWDLRWDLKNRIFEAEKVIREKYESKVDRPDSGRSRGQIGTGINLVCCQGEQSQQPG